MNPLEELTDDDDFIELINIVQNPRLPQTYRERPDHFNKWNDKEFKLRFRLPKPIVQLLIDEIAETISSLTNKNNALSPADMVFIALRFLATGSFLQVSGDFSGVDKSTASRAVYKVLRAIAGLKVGYIKMPRSEEEIQVVRQQFYNIAKFPKCIGAVDCTHIKIQNPGGEEAEIYRNRKSFFSLNVQVIGDASLKIRNIVCRWPGSAHDTNIFKNSRVRHEFESGVFGDNVIVGDSGYKIKQYLIIPLANPVTPAEHLFNEAQIRTRNPIERLFGVLKRRFPVLALGIRLQLHKVEALVISCAVLHNIAIMMGDDEPPINNEEIEQAIQLTNNVNNYIVSGQAIEDEVHIDNTTRHVLIRQYFQNLLNEEDRLPNIN